MSSATPKGGVLFPWCPDRTSAIDLEPLGSITRLGGQYEQRHGGGVDREVREAYDVFFEKMPKQDAADLRTWFRQMGNTRSFLFHDRETGELLTVRLDGSVRITPYRNTAHLRTVSFRVVEVPA
jgi:phage-related protein